MEKTVMQYLRVPVLKTQAPPIIRCDGCCRRIPTFKLGHVDRSVRLCRDCARVDLRVHHGVIAIFQAVVRARKARRFQFAEKLRAYGLHEIAMEKSGKRPMKVSAKQRKE